MDDLDPLFDDFDPPIEKTDIAEVANLINIRNYMVMISESMVSDKLQSREVGKMIPALDKFIASKITGKVFRTMINCPLIEKEKTIEIKSTLKSL